VTRTAVLYRTAAPGADSTEDEAVSSARFEVIAVVQEEAGATRAALGDALQQIADAGASALLVARLGAVAGSLRELLALIDWLGAVQAELVALDIELDTASPAGRRSVALLRELERWEREPGPGRPPRGRPGLASHAPGLSERIAEMRERGLSMQAIADTLNEDGVPTPRGGARWRPSSVQAALGYRRPRPRLPGAPPRPAPRRPPGRPPSAQPPSAQPPPAHPPPSARPPHEPPGSARRKPRRADPTP
jgi:hypothetical protein